MLSSAVFTRGVVSQQNVSSDRVIFLLNTSIFSSCLLPDQTFAGSWAHVASSPGDFISQPWRKRLRDNLGGGLGTRLGLMHTYQPYMCKHLSNALFGISPRTPSSLALAIYQEVSFWKQLLGMYLFSTAFVERGQQCKQIHPIPPSVPVLQGCPPWGYELVRSEVTD